MCCFGLMSLSGHFNLDSLDVSAPDRVALGRLCKFSNFRTFCSSLSESESELLLVTRSNDNHSPGPVMREVRP